MNHLEIIEKKIPDKNQLGRHLAKLRFKKKSLVFTNGCFDVLHRGHVDYLSKAKDLGDVLIIGLNTDRSVRKIKGENRPVQDEKSRALLLASFSFVDYVVLFDEETPYELIKQVQPDVLVKGADYAAKDIVGYDVVNEKGGQVKTIDFLDGFSTTSIIEKIKHS